MAINFFWPKNGFFLCVFRVVRPFFCVCDGMYGDSDLFCMGWFLGVGEYFDNSICSVDMHV